MHIMSHADAVHHRFSRGLSRRLLLALIGVGLSAFFSTPAFAQDWKAMDEANLRKEFKAVRAQLDQAKAGHENDVEWLWRMARSEYDLGNQLPDSDKRNHKHMDTGLEFAKKAVAANEKSADAHSWFSILIGKVGLLQGTEAKIKNSYLVKQHAMRAIELDPKDDTNYHIMGRWHYELSNLNWVERTVASMVYATPPKATYADSISYLSKARDLDPLDIQHYYWLARSQKAAGKKQDAAVTLNRAIQLKPRDEAEQRLYGQSKELLMELK